MKAWVKAEIVNIGVNHREVWFDPGPDSRRMASVIVPITACRKLDGSAVTADWPARTDDYRSHYEPALIEVEIVQDHDAIPVRFPLGEIHWMRASDVRVEGERGRPVYRLAFVGSHEEMATEGGAR